MAIKPTVGRVVWYYPGKDDAGFARNGNNDPYAAVVARVWSDTCVNLAVFDAEGKHHGRGLVPLVQPEAEAPEGAFCTWMPYQIGQAAKHGA